MAPKCKRSHVLLLTVCLAIFNIQTCQTVKSCVSCMTMDNIVASDAAKNILRTYNHDFCRTIERANNKSGIKTDFCESSSKIYEMKSCGILEGFINGTAFNHPMSLRIFYRGCLNIKSTRQNSCQSTESSQVDLTQNLAKVFNPLQDYTLHSFRGQRCICETDICDISSSSNVSLSLPLWIVAIFLSHLITK